MDCRREKHTAKETPREAKESLSGKSKSYPEHIAATKKGAIDGCGNSSKAGTNTTCGDIVGARDSRRVLGLAFKRTGSPETQETLETCTVRTRLTANPAVQVTVLHLHELRVKFRTRTQAQAQTNFSSEQQNSMAPKVFAVPRPTSLPTVTLKVLLRSTSTTKRAAEPTTLDVPPQAKRPLGEGAQIDVQSLTVGKVTIAGTDNEVPAEYFEGQRTSELKPTRQ